MRSESLDFHSICLGPFPQKPDKFEIKLSSLHQNKVEKIAVFNEDSVEKCMDWKQIIDPHLPDDGNSQ